MENNCPFKSTEKRLDDCLIIWENTKSSYFEPNSFILNLNNLIQNLRSVTFILQKNKNFSPNFDSWYEKWQIAMKKDPILVWLKEARNYIEKEGDLDTLSKIRLSIVNSYYEPPIFEKEIPPFFKTDEFIKTFIETKLNKNYYKKGLLRAERIWIDSKLKSREIIEATAYVYIFLLTIIISAHKDLLDSKIMEGCSWYYKNICSFHEIIPEMLNQNWDRTIWIDLSTREIINPDFKDINLDNNILKKAKKRYRNLENTKKELDSTKNFKEQVEIFFKNAKSILLKDKTHAPIIIIGYLDGHSKIIMYPIIKEYKYMFFRHIASLMKKTLATSIIIINEAWISEFDEKNPFLLPSDNPNRKEALCLIATNSKGEKYNYTITFNKDKNGDIIFGKEFSDNYKDSNDFGLLIPILSIWNQNP